MPEEDVVIDVLLPLLLVRKAPAPVAGDHAILKGQLQVLELQAVQVHLADVERAPGALQHRRGEDLPYRDVHIRHAVFKDGLLRRVLKAEELHGHVRPVAASAEDAHIRSLVQGVDEILLDLSVELRVQGVDPDHLVKNLRVLLPYLGDRPGNDGEAPLVSRDVLVGHLGGAAVIEEHQLLLLCRQRHCLLLWLRRKGLLPKGLHDGRPGKSQGQLFISLIEGVHDLQLPLHEALVEEKALVIPVVIVVLHVGDTAVVAHPPGSPLCQGAGCRPVYNRLKAHLPEIFHSFPHHSLKAQGVADIDRTLL